MEWKQKRPNWCPHKKGCEYIMSVQAMICAGKLPEPEPHDGDFNTHRLCLKDALPNDEIFDLQINSGDIYHFRRVFDAIDPKKEK